MKDKKIGFTTVELLTVLAIISLLIGVLLPALSAVRKAAKEAKQHAQLTTLDLAISAFKNDYGDYPPSAWSGQSNNRYCGSQKLAEAILGWDLRGFHPKSAWLADGTDGAGNLVYDSTSDTNLKERKGPYLELATANVFRLGNISSAKPGLFNGTGLLAPDTFVICDVFGVKRITLATGKAVIAGTPILYYKANTSSKSLSGSDPSKLIYDITDNDAIVALGRVANQQSKHERFDEWGEFYGYITDPKVTAIPWPYRPDSYILISAGADGFYGTPDDIRNFGY